MNETYSSIFEITNDPWAIDCTPSRVAQFEVVSRQQYNESIDKLIEKEVELTYVMDNEDIELPVRGTDLSAGYDFVE